MLFFSNVLSNYLRRYASVMLKELCEICHQISDYSAIVKRLDFDAITFELADLSVACKHRSAIYLHAARAAGRHPAGESYP